MKDILLQHFVILEQDGKRHLAQVIEIRQLHQDIKVQCYNPPFPLTSYRKSFNKMHSQVTVEFEKIIASLVTQPTITRRNQISLSKEQLEEIQNLSE
jgi:hypothetical protein